MFRKIALSSAVFLSLFSFSHEAHSQDIDTPEWLEAALSHPSTVSEEIDGIEYTWAVAEADLMHRVLLCIVSPCPDGTAVLNTAFVMTNVSDVPQTLSFPNSNLVTLEVRNTDSHVVLSSDEDAMFSMAIEEVTLQPGESKVVTQSLKLMNAAGEKLIGDFHAVAIVRSYMNPLEMATPIKVSDFVR